MKYQTDQMEIMDNESELKLADSSTTKANDDTQSDVSKSQCDPDISIEWKDMKISFRIVSDFDLDQEQKNRYELFPEFDSNSPSARSIPYMRRKANKEKFSRCQFYRHFFLSN